MTPDEAVAGAMVLDTVHETMTAWFNAGVEHVALSNGLPVESFTANDPPCRLQSARLRGLEVLSLNDDMKALAYAVLRSIEHVCSDAVATIESQAALSARLSTRGQA